MNRYGCDITDGLHIPDSGKQLIFGKYMVRILCKERQQIKFLCRKLLFFVVYPYTAGCFVNTDTTNLNNIIFLCGAANQTLITGQMRFYAGHQLTRRKRFCNIVISAQSESTDFVDIVFFCRNHQNRCVFLFTDLFTDFKTIRARQHQIQDKHVKILV